MTTRHDRGRPKECPRAGSRGGVIVFVAVCLMPVFGVLALTYDFSRLLTANAEQESNAEYAALAALEEFVTLGRDAPVDDRKAAGIAAAERSGGLNHVLGSRSAPIGGGELLDGTAGSVEFGHYSFHNDYFTTDPVYLVLPEDWNAVSVTVRTKPDNLIDMAFARVFGFMRGGSTSRVIAAYDKHSEFNGRQSYRIVR